MSQLDNNKNSEKLIPAIPPVDYKGSISGWIYALVDRDLIQEGDDDLDLSDLMIPEATWWEILEQCEKDS